MIRLIGRGSYGEVWLARNVMGTYRAVKLVRRDRFESARPFEREFAGLQKFEPISRSHEGLVQILHIGRAPAGELFYCVMELADDVADGPAIDAPRYEPCTLRAVMERRGPLPLETLLRTGLTLASALEHLHQHGLIHRDLKPSNIIFVNGRAKIADIGLISEVGEARSMVGTEGFIPPEGPGSPAADVFGLGKLLYEASTGKDRLKFPEVPQEWLADPAAHARFEFHEIVLRACESDAVRRYQSAAELVADLALLQSGRSVRDLRALERRLAWLKRAALVALGAAGIALALYWFAIRQARHDRDNLQRVQRAETEARHQLAAARLAQARATHHSGLAGQRFDCLEVLAAAARVKPSLELRNEAITALCLADLRPVRRITSLQPPSHALMEPRGLTYVICETNGLLTFHRVVDDVEIGRLPGALPEGWGVEDFGPGGEFISLQSPARELAVWSVARGARLLRLPPQPIGFLHRYSPDGRYLLWCSPSHAWSLVDLATGQSVAEWPVAEPVLAFAFHPNRPQIAVALAREPVVELQDLQSHAVLRRWELAVPQVFLAWDPSGGRLAGSGLDQAVRVWDMASTTNFLTLTGHENLASWLTFHPTEPWIVSSGWDGTIRLWDLRTGRQEALLREAGNWLRFTADGRQFAFCGGDGQDFVVCDVAAERPGRILRAPPATRQAGTYEVAFDPSGRWLAAGGHEQLRLFDTASEQCVSAAGTNQVFATQFAADGRHLYWAGEAGFWRARVDAPADARPVLCELTQLSTSNHIVHRVLVSSNVLVWNEADAIVVQRAGATVARLPFAGQADSLALSRDQHWFAAAERWVPFRVHIWETATWREVRGLTPETHQDRAQLLFTPDNRYLIVGGWAEYDFLRLTDGVIEHRLPRLANSAGPAYSDCSPDGKLLALAYSHTGIALYDYPGLRQLALLEPPQAADTGRLAFDPAGTRLAVAANGRDEVLLWDLTLLRHQLAAVGLDW